MLQVNDVAAGFAAKWKARVLNRPAAITSDSTVEPKPKPAADKEEFFANDPALDLANKWKRRLQMRLDKMAGLQRPAPLKCATPQWAGANLTEPV
jgi:hypothetical protein